MDRPGSNCCSGPSAAAPAPSGVARAAHVAHHNAEAAGTQAVISQLQDMALDPSMEQCCRRDLEDSIQRERIRYSLQRRDRVDARQRLAAAAVCTDAAAAAAVAAAEGSSTQAAAVQQPHQQQRGSGAADSELERLRQERLRQLRQQSAAAQEAGREGFGALNTVAEGRVAKLCMHDPPGSGLVVLHLAVQGHEPCNALDECLEQAAARYRGTFFARCVVSRGSSSRLAAELGLPHGVPALLVAKGGGLLGKAHISQFGGGDEVWDEQVLAYLRRFKVLSPGGASSSSGGSKAAAAAAAAKAAGSDSDAGDADDGSEEDDGGDDWLTPCEVCGRTYPHEHIRSMYSNQPPDSDDGDDDV